MAEDKDKKKVDKFPDYLLKRPASERKKYFHEFWVAHKRMEQVADEVLDLIYEPADAEIIYVIGPTGVGKTTLMMYLIKKLYERAMPELEIDPGKIPAAFIELDCPDRGSYNWTDHFINTLIALNEVLIDKKIYYRERGESKSDLRYRVQKEYGGHSALKRSAQSALENRILYAFFNDEAQYMTRRSKDQAISGRTLTEQADTIRSFAAKSKTLHVLVGTYDLRLLRNKNGQIGRRSHTVHFSRYSEKVAEDVAAFGAAFLAFQNHLPLADPPDLTRHGEFCFKRCLGCVGLLKSWFKRAYARALEDKCKTISSKLFLNSAPKKVVWNQIAAEINAGEQGLDEKDDELEDELRKYKERSALSPATSPRGGSKSPAKGGESSEEPNAGSKTRKRKRRPQRKPKRFPTDDGSDED